MFLMRHTTLSLGDSEPNPDIMVASMAVILAVTVAAATAAAVGIEPGPIGVSVAFGGVMH